jgi:hypothetical protein
MLTHSHAHASGEKHIPGVTHDPVLRPVGALMVVVGAIWAVFANMAVAAGTLGQAKAAGALIVLGLLLAAVGKPEQQI